jgi:PAS domain S-box-containing protein
MKNSTKLKSLSRQLIILFSMVIVLSGALTIIVTYQTGKSDSESQAQEKLDSIITYLSGTIEMPIWNLDIDTVRHIGKSVAQDSTIERIIITDNSGEALFETHKEKSNSSVSGKSDIYHHERMIGEVKVSISKEPFETSFNEFIKLTIMALLFEVVALIVFAGVLLRRLLRNPFSELEQIISHYSGGDYNPKVQGSSYTEFKTTSMVLENMGAKIISQVDELKRKVSELEDTQGALRESEEKYRRIFETVEDGYIRTAMDGTILSVNPATARILKYDHPNELEEKNIAQDVYVDPIKRQELKVALEEMGTLKGYRLEFRSKDNAVVSAECNIHLVRDEANLPIGIEGTIRDVTERNRAEKELEKYREKLEDLVEERTTELSIANERLKELDKLKSMFIASMSHELRTPLNSIIGFTGIILQGMVGKLETKQKDFLSRSYKSAKHLLALISDVIDISKIESGVVQAYPELFPLNEVLTEALDSASSHKKETVELKTIIPEGIEIYSDRQRVLQCILNLLSNALKYTQEGNVHISAVETDDQVEIRVKDTGIGISETDKEKLFQPFERLNSPMRITEAGTGLGLYLTRKLTAEVLDGSLRMESSLGKGSTFYLTLPKKLKPKDPKYLTSLLETT